MKHLFAGGNTPEGFYSYFHNILPFTESNKIIYLKGGPGTGKSTLMKRIGSIFEEHKYDVEYFHCSNDMESLDGIYIPAAKAAIMDATSPHSQDPILPMIKDEIRNLACCLKPEGLALHAEELQELLCKKKTFIQLAYGYLHSAYSVYQNSAILYEQAFLQQKMNQFILQTKERVFSQKEGTSRKGRHRKLFASAITGNGYVNFLQDLFTDLDTTILRSLEGLDFSPLLAKLLEEAELLGYDSEGYYSPLCKDKLEHLVIKELNCCFVTSSRCHPFSKEGARVVDIQEFCQNEKISRHKEILLYNQVQFDTLMDRAMDCLKKSSLEHGRMEAVYIPHMDFSILDDICRQITEELLQFVS